MRFQDADATIWAGTHDYGYKTDIRDWKNVAPRGGERPREAVQAHAGHPTMRSTVSTAMGWYPGLARR